MMDIFNTNIRWFILKTIIFLNIFNILVLLPFLQFYLFVNIQRFRFILSFILYLIYVFLLWRFINTFEEGKNFLKLIIDYPSLIESGLARISIIGVTLNAFLSGFGSVHWPLTNLGYLISQGINITTLQKRFYRMIDTIIAYKKKIIESQEDLENLNEKDRSFFSFSTSKSQEIKNNIANYQSQIDSMEEVSRELFYEIQDGIEERNYIKQSKTFKGLFFKFFGYIFSIYGVYRVFMAFLNLILNRYSSKVDPIENVGKFDSLFRLFISFQNIFIKLILT